MKKSIVLAIAMLMATATSIMSQTKVFNHLGADLSVGTTGIGVELSSPITDYVQMRAGVPFMPGFTFNANIDGNVQVSNGAQIIGKMDG